MGCFFSRERPNRAVVDLMPAQRESVEELMADASKKLGMDVSNHYNIAVAGRSGAGKSNFINSYRLLQDNHPAAARVGETETTTQIARYADPANPHVMLWDVPGAGTSLHPESTYFEDNMLYAFDCILVLSSDRFMKVEFDIAKKAMRYKRQCAFVRTKAYQSLKSIAEREAKTMQDASKYLRLIVTESFQKGLQDAGFQAGTSFFQLFIVSGLAFVRRNAYTVYNAETGEPDTSLQKMDEDQCICHQRREVSFPLKRNYLSTDAAFPPRPEGITYHVIQKIWRA